MKLRVNLPLQSPNFEEAKSKLKALGFSFKREVRESYKKVRIDHYWELELPVEEIEATRQELMNHKLYALVVGPHKVCKYCPRQIRYNPDGSERACGCFKY